MNEIVIYLCLGAILGYYLGFWHGQFHPKKKAAGARQGI